MRFARWVFLLAGIYGLLLLTPQYLLEGQVGRDQPPAITHPEFYFGFLGVALAWQTAFLCIATNPPRYRLLMLPSVLEKFSFAAATAVLFAQGRLAAVVLGFGMIDLLLGCLFIVAFLRCPADSTHRS
ncbi:MAG: hypothetical protein RIC55_23280 [Pirellulaceae bacterium]